MNTTNKETGIETPATASVEAPIDVMEADEVINTKKPKRQKRKIVIILLAIVATSFAEPACMSSGLQTADGLIATVAAGNYRCLCGVELHADGLVVSGLV